MSYIFKFENNDIVTIKSDVNNILIKDILQKYGEASSFVDNHPRVE